jgi:hypothetical protein
MTIQKEEYLVHFTSFKPEGKEIDELERDSAGFNKLLLIIKNGFMFHGNKTYTPRETDDKSVMELTVGMICFTTLFSLNEIRDRKEKFGNFGICMKRDWINKYSGQPVSYAYEISVTNKILCGLNNLAKETRDLSEVLENEPLKNISNKIAYLSTLLQATTEPIEHTIERETRIIDDPHNERIENGINAGAIWETKDIGSCEATYAKLCLSISNGDDAEFFIMPKKYKEDFCNKVINGENNSKKIRFIEDILSYE